MKSILLHVGDDSLFESRLKAALQLTRTMEGHLSCLQTRRLPSYLGADLGGFVGSASMVVQLIDEENKAIEARRKELEGRLEAANVPFDFVDAIGNIPDILVNHSLLVDAVVMSLGTPEERALASALSATITISDAPVLAVPPGLEHLDLEKPIMLAWKPTAEAAHAVKGALPLLKRAPRVDVVSVELEEDGYSHVMIGNYLRYHGVNAAFHKQTESRDNAAKIILRTAEDIGVGLIVMGAYGRSRAMEFLLGGVTRHLVQNSRVPLLLAH